MSGVFGGGGGGPPGYIKEALFQNYGTGSSFLKPKTGKLTLDPTVDALRTGYLENLEGIEPLGSNLQGFGQRFSDLSTEFAGNQGALINARMNPIRAQVARAEGDLRQSLGRRELTGSSFGNQAIQGFNFEAGRTLADQEALATQDMLAARDMLLKGEMTAEQANVQNEVLINQLLGGASADVLAQELQKIGLSADVTASILGINQSAEAVAASERANKFNSMVGIAGAGFGAAGNLFTSGGGVTAGSVTSNPSVFNRYAAQPMGTGGFGTTYKPLTF